MTLRTMLAPIRWLLALLLYTWALPNTLVGFVLLATWYFPKSVRWQHGALEAVPRRDTLIGGSWVGAQTFGWLIFAKNEGQRDRIGLAVHERVHVRHALKGGVFFALAYGSFFMYHWCFGLRMPWKEAYRRNWFERIAYAEGDFAQRESNREVRAKAIENAMDYMGGKRDPKGNGA